MERWRVIPVHIPHVEKNTTILNIHFFCFENFKSQIFSPDIVSQFQYQYVPMEITLSVLNCFLSLGQHLSSKSLRVVAVVFQINNTHKYCGGLRSYY